MEGWVVEGDFALKETDEDDGASVSDKIEGGVHGAGVAGMVRNNISGRKSDNICRFEFGEFFNFVTPPPTAPQP